MHEIAGLVLPMPGRHNALNATAAIAVARELGVADAQIRKRARRLRRREAPFHPHRRLERRDGDRRLRPPSGRDRRRACRGARVDASGQVIAVVQPHRYTRLASLFEPFCTCFNDADAVVVAHVYPAGEAADRGHRPRRAGAGHARARPPPGDRARRAAAARRHRARAGAARRLRGLPRRRHHHAMGLRATGRARRARAAA